MSDEKQLIEEKVKCDIIAVLDKLIFKLQRKDIKDLSNISNEIIHCASVFQDVYSVSIAVVTYALYKMLERENNINPEYITRLIKARNYLQKYKIEKFNREINRLTKDMARRDKLISTYVRHVFNEAEIKKGSKIYDHGISLAQTAKLLNISQWELMKYVGKIKVIDFLPEKIDIKLRLQFTRALFKQMKTVVFDSGPIISLTINNLLWLLDQLKINFKGDFVITPSVYEEVITQPLSTRKYKLEALQVLPYINKKTLNLFYNKTIQDYAQYLLDLINSCFKAFGNDIQLVHFAEMEVVSCAKFLKAEAIVIDERTTRKLIEDPEGHVRYLEKKLGTKIIVEKEKFQRIKEELKGLKVIRSIELAVISFELGLFKEYTDAKLKQVDLKKAVLEGVLWGIKLNGCSVREDEIDEIMSIELK